MGYHRVDGKAGFLRSGFRVVFFFAIALLAGSGVCGRCQAVRWTINSAQSRVEFSVKHLSLSTVHGTFAGIQGVLDLNPAQIDQSRIEVTIPIDSISTGASGRDTVLKSADFFDADRFRTAEFRSSRISQAGAQLKLYGMLTIHGIAKPVELDVKGPMTGDGKTSATYQGELKISRSSFGVGTVFPPALIGDEIQISIALEVMRN